MSNHEEDAVVIVPQVSFSSNNSASPSNGAATAARAGAKSAEASEKESTKNAMTSSARRGTARRKGTKDGMDKFSIILLELAQNPNMLPDRERVKEAVYDEFPDTFTSPSGDMLDDSVLRQPNPELPILFGIGQWAERLGDDMKWHLEQIRRLVIEEEEEGETKYFYRMANGSTIHHEDIRAPEEGLKRIFSARPWCWQQYALLRVELYCRFQEEHERDFAIVDFVVIAHEMWEEWLNDPRNADFKKLFESKPASAQAKLVHFILQPFRFMKEVVHDDEKWGLSTNGVSVFQYASFLGSGLVLSFVILFLQLCIPFLLLLYSVRISNRFINFEQANSMNLHEVFETDWNTFCNVPTPIDVFLMNVVVWLVYAIRVVPEVIDVVYSTLGDKPSIASRLNSLRSIIYDQGDDTFFQIIGFKLDRYMNGFYVALINIIMLFILFLTDNTVDIVLNALAIEFVYKFDNEIGESEHYDPGRRYLKAGVVELIFRSELKLDVLSQVDYFCKEYDIDMETFMKTCKGPMKDLEVARRDVKDTKYMSAVDKVWAIASQIALESGKIDAVDQYCEKGNAFGIVDRLLVRYRETAIMKRYPEFYVWSRWEHARFLSRLPEPGKILISPSLPTTKVDSTISVRRFGKSPEIAPLNFDSESVLPSYYRFSWELINVLLFGSFIKSIKTAIRIRQPIQIPFRILDGIFEWFTTWFILLFPVGLIVYGYFVFACEPLGEV